eukprot:2854378-Rhodomonas_salina.1
MPAFFNAPEISGGVMDNVFDNQYYSLDDSPVSWHITEVRHLPYVIGFVVAGSFANVEAVSLTRVLSFHSRSTRPPTRASTSATSSTSTKRCLELEVTFWLERIAVMSSYLVIQGFFVRALDGQVQRQDLKLSADSAWSNNWGSVVGLVI